MTKLSVDYDENFEDVELPELFTRSTLDTDEESAAKAGKCLSELAECVENAYFEVEVVERALRESEPHSERARQAREWIRKALAAFDYEFLNGLEHANGALVRYWGDPPHIAGNPARIQPTVPPPSTEDGYP